MEEAALASPKSKIKEWAQFSSIQPDSFPLKDENLTWTYCFCYAFSYFLEGGGEKPQP